MNQLSIIVQAKDDPKNLLTTKEKADAFPEGMTIAFMEGATQKGQLGIEFIFKGQDIYGKETITGYALTENNMEALMGAFIGARMRFGRMPDDQWEMVRHYVKDKAKRFLQSIHESKRALIESDVKRFFGI